MAETLKYCVLKDTWKNYRSLRGDPGTWALEGSKVLPCRNLWRVVFPRNGIGVGQGATLPGGSVSKRKQCHRTGQLTNNCGCGPGLGLAFHKAVEKPSLDQSSPR